MISVSIARGAVAAAVLSALAGCAAYPSLHGLPEDRAVELPEAFLGAWRQEQGDELLEIVVSGTLDDGYEAHVRFAEDDEVYQLRLGFEVVRLGDQVLLDATLAHEALEQLYREYGALVIPAHVFLRITGGGDAADLYWLDPYWMEEAGELVQPRVRDEETLPIWTREPESVLATLEQAAATEEAWVHVAELARAR